MKEPNSFQKWKELLEGLWPVAKGSLNQVRKKCSRSGCKACSSGVKHPAWLFTYRKDGKLHSLHVPKEWVSTVRKAIENGRRLEQALVDAGVQLIRERDKEQR